MRAINATVMRQANKTLLLNSIRTRPISRAELAEETGLTRASVTQIIEELINDDLVIETSMVERSRLGRRSTQLAINPKAGCLFGVTLQPMNCTVGATDMLGRALIRNIEVTNGRRPDEVLDAVANLILSQTEQLGAHADRIYGIGVSVPGPVDQASGKVRNLADMPEWDGLALQRELSLRTGLKVHIESAANAQALEQKYFGGAGRNFALIRLEDTLSVGVVIQDMLYRGSSEFVVELGQCPADPEGKRTLNQLLAGDSHVNWQKMLENPDGAESERIMMQLSYPLASVMCIYQLKHAVLGGAVGRKMIPLLPQLTGYVKRLLPAPVNESAEVTVAETDPVRMAAAAAYHRIFSL